VLSRKQIAYHEAGHLAASHLLWLTVSHATIEPSRTEVGGFVDSDEDFSIYKDPNPARRTEMARRHIIADYCGYAAERLVGSKDKWHHGSRSDYVRARGLAKEFGLDARALRLEARRLMQENFCLVNLYAEALLESGTLYVEALVRLAQESGIEPVVDF